MNQQEVLELIKKCFALSKSTNEAEASLALHKAQELLEKFNLSILDLKPDKEDLGPNMLNFPIPCREEWKKSLVHVIAQNNFCKVVICGENTHILGRSVNVLAVLEMSIWILPQLDGLAFFATHVHAGRGPKLRFRTAFLMGAVARINERLKEGRDQRLSSTPQTTALVTNLAAELANYLQQQYPNLSKRHTNRSFDSQGYSAGRAAGDQVSLYGSSRQVTDQGPLMLQ